MLFSKTALVLLALASVAEAAPCTFGNCCSANGYTSSTSAQALALSTLVGNVQSSFTAWNSTAAISKAATYPPFFLTCGNYTQQGGFYTVSGVATFTSYGKSTVGTSYVTISAFSTSPTVAPTTPQPSVSLAFGSGVSNTVNRGDYNTYTVYLPAAGDNLANPYLGVARLTMEVCSTPVASSPTNVLVTGVMPAAYTTTVTTTMFTSASNVSAWAVSAKPPLPVSLTNQVPGAFCDGTQKPAYDNALVTFSSAKILQCSNPLSVAAQGPSKTGVMTNYGVCQASSTPLTDRNSAGVCTTCMWDKYSQYFISTDNGATGIMVSGSQIRPWTSFQMSVGASLSITGILSFQGSSGWVLTPRDANDFVGLTALTTSQSLPTVFIGDQVTGMKQQQYQWSSPGPTLASIYDPNGVTAVANLPLGMSPRVLGPLDVIQNGSSTLYGTGVYYCQSGGADATCSNSAPTFAGTGAAPGQLGWVPDWNGCPNASAFQWLYAVSSNSVSQTVCACYPPRYYSPTLGSNGAGTTYTQITGVISFIEGFTPASGINSFYMQSGNGVNQALLVYQDGQAGVSVNLGDNVTIQATAYSYYGLVETQNTLSVKINSRGNTVPAPIDLYSLADLDVKNNGHCAAQTVLYRGNKVTLHNMTVSKVFMFEPFPYLMPGSKTQAVQYWYNGTNVGTAFVPQFSPYFTQLGSPAGTAAFNSSVGLANNNPNPTSGPAMPMGNWYNSQLCTSYGPTGATVWPNHPLTNAPFLCGFEVTDGQGNYIVVDQAKYGTNGGLIPAFMGSDNATRPLPITNPDGTVTPACTVPPCPLMVGDTFLTISGVLKYNRGGTSREVSAGGNLQLVPFGILGDANPAGSVLPLTGRNVPIVSVSTVSLTFTTTIQGGITAALVNSNVALSTAIRASIANSLSPPLTVSQVVITAAFRRRSLLDTSITYVISVPATQASSISSQVVTSSFQNAMSTAVVSSVNGLGLGSLVTGATSSVYIGGPTATTNNKSVLAVGLGVGIGGGCGVIILLGLLYRFVLKKKNIEQGQKSAVMMTPAGAST